MAVVKVVSGFVVTSELGVVCQSHCLDINITGMLFLSHVVVVVVALYGFLFLDQIVTLSKVMNVEKGVKYMQVSEICRL